MDIAYLVNGGEAWGDGVQSQSREKGGAGANPTICKDFGQEQRRFGCLDGGRCGILLVLGLIWRFIYVIN